MSEEKPLPDRAARSLPFGGGCAVALGAFLVAFGLMFVLAFGAVVLTGGFPSSARPQLWSGGGAFLFVIGLGVGLALHGVGDWRRAARAKDLAARHPDQPWFADSPWDPRGVHEPAAFGLGGFFVAAFILLIIAPFNVAWPYAFDTSNPPGERLMIGGMLLIPNFFIYLLIKGVFLTVRDRRRHGRAYLAFDPFPFFLGETLAARVTAKALAGQEDVVATLRCVDERMVTRRYRGRHMDSVQPYQVYEARQTLPGPFGGEDVPLTFALPAQPPTELLRQPPRYWELEIRGSRKDDTVVFTVPVYARPGINAPPPAIAVPTANSRGINRV